MSLKNLVKVKILKTVSLPLSSLACIAQVLHCTLNGLWSYLIEIRDRICTQNDEKALKNPIN